MSGSRKARRIFLLSFPIFLVVGCQHSKLKLRKGALLDVTMDPAKSSSPLSSSRQGALGWYEKGAPPAGAVVGQSCPTCG